MRVIAFSSYNCTVPGAKVISLADMDEGRNSSFAMDELEVKCLNTTMWDKGERKMIPTKKLEKSFFPSYVVACLVFTS